MSSPPVGWQTNRLIGRSVGRSVRKSDGQLVGWSIGRSIDRSVGWLVGWSVSRLHIHSKWGQTVPSSNVDYVPLVGVGKTIPREI